jgi:hypothetical protein
MADDSYTVASRELGNNKKGLGTCSKDPWLKPNSGDDA